MAGRYRFALRPKWWVGHVLVVAAAVTMIFLGRWQLHVSERKGFSLQNFGYALQWWVFSLFAVVMWLKIIRDVVREPAARAARSAAPTDGVVAPIEYRRYRPPERVEVDDPVTAQYNEYLASLAERSRPKDRS